MRHTVPTGVYVLLLIFLIGLSAIIYRAVLAPPSQVIAFAGGGALIENYGHTILIDTGSDASILRALGTTLLPWQRSIDLLVLTGTSSKERGGEAALRERYRILETIAFGPATPDAPDPLPYGTPLQFGTMILTVTAPGVYALQ